jgi:cytochrome c-type biogenesis protein CcmE
MDPSRKRQMRFTAALTAALLLATALAYTSFAGASATVQPSDLLKKAAAGKTYELTGTVAKGSWKRNADGLTHEFRVQDRKGRATVPVRYRGAMPDPFREGREIIVDVTKQGAGFVGVKDTLITKCPSKFEAEKPQTR